MSRRSSGLIGTWAEAQRQRERARLVEQREAERRRRAEEREAARGRREQQVAYRRYREAEAQRRTEEWEARVAALQGLLAAGCRAPGFRAAALGRTARVEPFVTPDDLAVPVPMPRLDQFPVRTAWGQGGNRRVAEQEAHARYTQAWQAAQAAEQERRRRLAEHRERYDRRAAEQSAEVARHNDGLEELAAALRAGDPEAVVEYFSAALYASSVWPQEWPREPSAVFDPVSRQLVVDWELPGWEEVPAVRSVRYLPSTDQDKETPRPVTQRRGLYRELIAQCLLLVLRELFAADESGVVDSVAVNGFVDEHDPVTGRPGRIVLASVRVARSAFARLHLEQVSPVDCLVEGLGGRLSARPDLRTAVRPEQGPVHSGGAAAAAVPVPVDGGAEGPDLLAMDPIAFEHLVAELFRAMGMEAVTTQRSNDGGVDVEAVDPAPIRGGRIVVQVKRYRNTVPPTAVRDLYGTVQDAGANKGVLVTTSGFGPGSRAFAEGKPLELVSGPELVDLLHRHGLRGRLGDGTVPAPRRSGGAAPAPATTGPAAEYNVLGMSWAGSVALDVCALVCTGGRVLSEEHFVFFNNPRTPDGSVRTRPHPAPDRAALEVAFEALPAAADRLVLVAAVDEEAGPRSDLAGFTRARIRLRDGAGAELGELEVSDGRPGETALVLGSFRRRPNGDWDFVIGGRGYRGGLAELLRDFGVDVE
ncbi:restriction endonuclease [Streptomyces sp. NPDC097619]|uniref:restriction endonuclease n=1 Tax=Streptomyces sp. NPDC097619 TaxID=3157228 RepID=UPI003333962A